MAAAEQKAANQDTKDSKAVIRGIAANELFFAVVGPVGAGSSHVARQLERCLKDTSHNGSKFSCEILKAGDVIGDWVKANKIELPNDPLDKKIAMQTHGDEMRKTDHAAIALRLVEKIAETRAKSQNRSFLRGQVVPPDGKPRAYILDSLKHPAEARILQKLYGDAFVLIGVVCSEPVRKQRLLNAFFTGVQQGKVSNQKRVDEFMARDSDDRDNKFGQHVTDAFQEADFFVDNTAKVAAPNGEMKDAVDLRLLSELNRLVSIIIHRSVLRPTIDETAKLRST